MPVTFEQITEQAKAPDEKMLFTSFDEEVQTRQLFRQGLSEKVFNHPMISGDTKIEDEDERARLANSVFIARTYNIPVSTALANHDGIIEHLFGKDTKPKQAFIKIRDLYKTDQERFDEYHTNTPWKQETKDWLSGSWAQMKLQFSGLVEAITDTIGGKKLNEWSVQMRQGVYDDMQAHPEKFLRPPGVGYWDTTANYLKHPEYIVWGIAEQVPIITVSLVSGGTAGAIAKGAGLTAKGVKTAAWLGRVQGFAVPIFGANYSDLRQQNVEPMRALPEAFLRAQGEALLEEWTLSKKLSLFKATGSQAKRGIGELVAKYLLDKPIKRALYGATSAYARGAFEEGTQRINDNFWSMVFRDVDTTLFEGAASAAAAGGILELSMTGVFKAGARAKEKVTGVKMVSLDEQLARIEVIREEINKAPLSAEHKAEVNAELDSVRTEVEEGKFKSEPPKEVTEVAPEKLQTLLGEIRATPQYGIEEAEGKWIVKDYITQQEISVHKSDREAIRESNKLNREDEVIREVALPIEVDTIRQMWNHLVKQGKISKTKQGGYLQGAKDVVRGHTNLAKWVNTALQGVDITKAQRKQLFNAVSSPRTSVETHKAIQTILRITDIVKQQVAIKDLRKTMAFINRKVGKRMQEGGIRPEYYIRIRDVLDGFFTKKIPPKMRARLESLKGYLENVKSQGLSQFETDYIEARIPQKLLDKLPLLEVKNINDMTLEELEDANQTLQQLVSMNQLKNRLLGLQIADSVSDMLNTAMEEVGNIPDKAKKQAYITSRDDPNKKNIITKFFNFFAGNKNHDVETLSETISGTHGTIHDVLANGLSRGRRVESGFKNDWDDIIAKHFAAADITLDDLQGMSDLFFQVISSPKIREAFSRQGLNVKMPSRQAVTVGGKKVQLTNAEMLSIYMHARAGYNLREIVKSGLAFNKQMLGKITQEEINDIVDIINKNKKAMSLVDMADELHEYSKKKINEVSTLLDGIELANVLIYWHIDRFRTGGLAGRQTFRNSLLESLGLLKERTGGKNPIVINDFFASLLYEQQLIAEYVGLAKPLRNVKNLLNYKPFRHLLQGKGYKEELKLIGEMIERTEQKPRTVSVTDGAVSHILRGLTRAVLANPGIMLGQYASVVCYFTEVDLKYINSLRGIGKKAEIDRYKKMSPSYRRRVDGLVSSIATQDIKTDATLRAYTGKIAAINMLTRGIHAVDSVAITEAARLTEAEMADKDLSGKSLEYWENVGIEPIKLEKDTAEYTEAFNDRFDFLVRRTQPMFNTENRSILTSAESTTEKSLYLFRSYIDQPLRMGYRAYNMYNNKQISAQTLVKQIAIIWTGLAFYEIIRFAVRKGLIRSDDDDEKDLLLALGVAPIKTLNLIGYPAQRLIKDLFAGQEKRKGFYPPELSPLPIQFVNDILKSISLIARGMSYVGSNERFQSGKRYRKLKSEEYIKDGFGELAKNSLKYLGVPVKVIEDIIKEKEPKKRR